MARARARHKMEVFVADPTIVKEQWALDAEERHGLGGTLPTHKGRGKIWNWLSEALNFGSV